MTVQPLTRARGSSARRAFCLVGILIAIVVLAFFSSFSTHEAHPAFGAATLARSGRTLPSQPPRFDDGTEDPLVPMRTDPDEEMVMLAQEGGEGRRVGMSAASLSQGLGGGNHSHYVTVVLMSYPKSTRFHLLEQIIRKVCKWNFVWEVILVWNGDRSLLPVRIAVLQTELAGKGKTANPTALGDLLRRRTETNRAFFTVLPQQENRVDNRWRIGEYIDTDACLNMDDDINLYEEGAKCMLDVWRASPTALVSIDVRSHFTHAKVGGGPFGAYGYVARDRSAGFKQYSIALPRALLTNRAYYVAYDAAWRRGASFPSLQNRVQQQQPWAGFGVKRIVDELLCDDIAFNFVAANTSLSADAQLPGGHVVYVKAKYAAYPESHSADGMTKRDGMKAMRQKCINALAQSIGGGEVILRHRPWHVVCDVDG